MYTIYCAYCKPSQKIYVGQTVQGLARRKAVHYADALRDNGRSFCRAIRDHGRDAFVWQELARVETKAEADEFEKYWIAFLGGNDKKCGYNLTTGGDGYCFTKEAREKVRANTPRGERHAYFGKELPSMKACREALKKKCEAVRSDPRNTDITRLHSEGHSIARISDSLGMTRDTVRWRVRKILNLPSRPVKFRKRG